MTIGERIKEVRSRLNMSQVSFADKIDVSKQTLYKYENNIITNIPSDKIEAIAKIGNVSPAYLMGWDEEPTYESNDDIREIQDILIDMNYSVNLGFSRNYGHSLTVKKADQTHSIELKNSDLHNILNQSNQFMKYLLSNCIEEKYANEDYKKDITEEEQIKRIFGYPESEEDIKEYSSLRNNSQLNAAHKRTDLELQEGTDTSDNDIMDDENF